LSLPFRATDPEPFADTQVRVAKKKNAALDATELREAFDRANAHATAEIPSLRFRADAIDFSSPLAFAKSFNEALQDQAIDLTAKPARAAAKKKAKRAAAPEPNWDEMEDAIVAKAKSAVAAFAKKHGPACALFFDTDPPASYVLMSFEGAKDLVAGAAGHLENEAKRRKKMLATKNAWKQAQNYLRPRLDEAIDVGSFEQMDFDRIDFGEAMNAFAESDACPEAPYGVEPYVSARFRMVLANAIDRLVEKRALVPIVGDAPLLVGYAIHDEPPVVLRIVRRASKVKPRSASRGGR
jgi:hypothetical protein